MPPKAKEKETAKELSLPKVIPAKSPAAKDEKKNTKTNDSPSKTKGAADAKGKDAAKTKETSKKMPPISPKSPKPTIETPSNVMMVSNSNNGNINIKYNHYNKPFKINNGMLTSNEIDETFSLSFVFKNCIIHLSKHGPNDFSYEDEGLKERPPLWQIEEKPVGTYLNLVNDETYFVIVEESSEEAQKYEAKQKLIIEESAKKAAKFLTSDDDDLTMPVETRRKEGCSCLYGNPCVDNYVCQNWDKRYEIAKKNGWKGFS